MQVAQGEALRRRQVSIRLEKVASAKLPCAVRVPWPIRRRITPWLSRRSAYLLVSGRWGCASTWKIASQSLRKSPLSAWVRRPMMNGAALALATTHRPEELPGLVVRCLVAMQQLGWQDLLLNPLRDRFAGVGRFVDGLGDGAGGEGEPEQFAGELLATAYR